MGPTGQAVRRAALWTSIYAPIWAVGSYVVAQFPISVDPMEVVDRPIKWLIIASAFTWELQMFGEIGLAVIQGPAYPAMGPFSGLLAETPEQERPADPERARDAMNGCLYVFLLAAPALLIASTTTKVLAIIWILIQAGCLALHYRNMARRFMTWHRQQERNRPQ